MTKPPHYDIEHNRAEHERVQVSSVANLPSRYGTFKIQVFKAGEKEHLAIFTDPLPELPVVRIHSECLTGDALGSLKCDCGSQIADTLRFIAREGGMVLYLRQEGRGIGLLNKVNAYALQDQGYDTVEANRLLGFGDDERTFGIAEYILEYYGIRAVRLVTNNPRKIAGLGAVEVVERIPCITEPNACNVKYLGTKKKKLGHLF